MQRNRLDPDEQQSELARLLVGAEPAPSQWSWEFQKPLFMDWVRNTLMTAPLAMGPRGGAMARMLEARMPMKPGYTDSQRAAGYAPEPVDPGITGGLPKGATRGPEPNAGSLYNSSTGMVGQNPGAFGRQEMTFSAPLNRNNPAFGRSEFKGSSPQDIFRQIEGANLSHADRQYLLALARQRFSRPPSAAND